MYFAVNDILKCNRFILIHDMSYRHHLKGLWKLSDSFNFPLEGCLGSELFLEKGIKLSFRGNSWRLKTKQKKMAQPGFQLSEFRRKCSSELPVFRITTKVLQFGRVMYLEAYTFYEKLFRLKKKWNLIPVSDFWLQHVANTDLGVSDGDIIEFLT